MKSFSPDTKTTNIGCVIMASGLGVRFGGNKLMADFGGKPMVSWIIDLAIECFENIVVVTRNNGVVELCEEKNVNAIYHEYPYRSDTIRLGVNSMSSDVDGVVFCLADQPFLSIDTLERLIESASSDPNSIWRVMCDGTIGSPSYFPRKYFAELASLPDDKGGSYVCKNHPEDIRILSVENPIELMDIDTRDVYEKYLSLADYLGFWNNFLKSNKKHLFITGNRGSGKTTLMNSLRPLIGNKISGLTSFATKGVDVRLINDRTKEEIVIGKFIPDDFAKSNRMTPNVQIFDTRGVEFVNELISADSSWVTIDEIGYLEEFSSKYQDAIRRLLDTKRVVAIIRKDDLKFLTELIEREDTYVIDIDVSDIAN